MVRWSFLAPGRIVNIDAPTREMAMDIFEAEYGLRIEPFMVQDFVG